MPEREGAESVGEASGLRIRQASNPEDVAAVHTLFEEYAATIRTDLCFQGFAQELATLPGSYAPPRGRLLLATDTHGPAGCVGLRPVGDAICEMKRLFVRSPYQGRGLGRTLAQRVIAEARAVGLSGGVGRGGNPPGAPIATGYLAFVAASSFLANSAAVSDGFTFFSNRMSLIEKNCP